MSKIYLVSNYNNLDLPRDHKTLWLYHEKDCQPQAERCITLKAFLDDPWGAIRDIDLLVVVGLVSRLCRPSNRVRLGQFLTEPWDGPERISVDDKLFIVDPWRMWWHFGCVGINYGGCYTSYTLETRWNGFVVGMRENPCAPEELERYGEGVIKAIDPFKFDIIDIHVEPMSAEVHERYMQETEAAFNEELTPTAIIKRLVRFANLVYPPRNVPSFSDMFSTRELIVRATDLGVDRFLVGQIKLRAELINYAARRFVL